MTPSEHPVDQQPWHQLPDGLADHLVLEATLSAPIRDAALDRASLTLDAVPESVIDLGSGIGADAVALAERFPAATVHAADVSSELLEYVASTASRAGLADRIERHKIDLNGDWPAHFRQPADLVWASLSLHHLADPGQALSRILTSLRPGGVLVLTELTGEDALSPSDLDTGSAGLQDRLKHTGADHHRPDIVDWSALLTRAGFAEWTRHEYEFIAQTDTAAGTQFLELQLRSRRAALREHLPHHDLAALDAAIEAVTKGTSRVSFRSPRTVWLARRPSLHVPVGQLSVTADPAQTADPSQTADAVGVELSENPRRLDVDVAVLGGGPAGLAAAIALARSRRTVAVIDAGEPRNAPARSAHNVLGHEGISPVDLLARGRAEAESYGVRLIAGRATGVTGAIDEFRVQVDDGALHVRARRVILATGLIDDLPNIPGVAEGWGHTVLHCPFCHGWEVRDQRIAILTRGNVAIHHAMLFSQLSRHVTVFLHDAGALTDAEREQLAALRVTVVRPRVERLVMEGALVRAVQVEGGRSFDTDAVVIAPRFNARDEIYEMLGGTAEDTPFGLHIPADPRGMTPVPGVWAVGNASQPMAMIAASIASGVTAGTAMVGDLAAADLSHRLAARSANPR